MRNLPRRFLGVNLGLINEQIQLISCNDKDCIPTGSPVHTAIFIYFFIRVLWVTNFVLSWFLRHASTVSSRAWRLLSRLLGCPEDHVCGKNWCTAVWKENQDLKEWDNCHVMKKDWQQSKGMILFKSTKYEILAARLSGSAEFYGTGSHSLLPLLRKELHCHCLPKQYCLNQLAHQPHHMGETA